MKKKNMVTAEPLKQDTHARFQIEELDTIQLLDAISEKRAHGARNHIRKNLSKNDIWLLGY